MDKNKLKELGIHEGQLKSEYSGKMTHNSGWYDENGAKIGWGDLSVSNFKTIQENLKETEVFYVLSEQDSYWSFMKELKGWNGHPIGDMKENYLTPGKEYVRSVARYFINKNGIFIVENEWIKQEPFTKGGIEFKVIKREDLG